MLFGQRVDMKNHVQQVRIGDVLFLHKVSKMKDISSQFLEGPFFATSNGKENIEPQAWGGDFSWQVQVERRGNISRISQNTFQTFQLNYSFAKIYFDFQIDSILGRKLMEELGLEVSIIENRVTNYEPLDNIDIDIRLRYPAKYRCNDGHYVRSKNEVIIDNWLFEKNIAHAYEKKIEGQNMLCDFFIKSKTGKYIFIEVWGLNDEKYLQRKKEKENIYKNNNLILISISENEIQNIDDFLGDLTKRYNLI